MAELQSLRKIAKGMDSGFLPRAHVARVRKLGWIEGKFGGDILTSMGGYQLEIRKRDKDLTLLAIRWHQRPEELRTIAENMTTGEADTL